MVVRLLAVLFCSLCASTSWAQSIHFLGTCPGTMSIAIDDMTPGGEFAILAGTGTGTLPLTSSPCPDAEASFSSLSRKFGPFTDDGSGSFTASPTIAGWACSLTFQVIDLDTCSLSDPVTLSSSLEGYLYAADGRGGTSGSSGPGGFYLIDVGGGTTTAVGAMDVRVTGLSYGPDGLLYGVQADGRNYPGFLTIDPLTAEQSMLSESTDIGSMSAFAWSGSELYGWTESSDSLTTIDPLTGDVTIMSYSTSSLHNCFATSAAGDLYLINNGNVSLIDPTVPTVSPLGSISGMTAGSGAGCTFHNGDLYVATGSSKSLYRVDIATLDAEDMGIAMPDDIDALASPTP